MISSLFSIISPIFSNLFLWLWLAGFGFLWWATRGKGPARRWTFVLLAALWLMGSGFFASISLFPLESRYPVPSFAKLQEQGVRQVVVLTGGGYDDHGGILSGAFPPASIYRFLGGLELCVRLGPECRVIFSGSAGAGKDFITTAETMKSLARLLSPQCKADAEVRSGTTAEHPHNVRPLLKSELFALVTSAYHLPRAMLSFRRAGLHPVPYPVNFMASPHYRWADFIPSFEGYSRLNLALREYVGLLYYWITGR
jgi:uncharacterized SAM-binding protein YcdF (DUF218 family)